MTALVAATLLATLQQVGSGSGLTVAIDVERLEGGAQPTGVNAERAMPMASTFKLPLAVVVMRAIDKGELPALDATVKLLPSDMYNRHSALYDRMPNGGPATMREVLSLMLEQSDNSAADALLRMAGGAAKVTATLRAMGLFGISIDRGEAAMRRDITADTPAKQRAALDRFSADPRDHASPAAMARLIARLWRGELLSAASTAFVEEHMARCSVGARRLRAGVPAKTPVADRTGTCFGAGDDDADCANDAGVVTLPSGQHVIVAVYVAGAGPLAAKEKLIAEVARAVWAAYAR